MPGRLRRSRAARRGSPEARHPGLRAPERLGVLSRPGAGRGLPGSAYRRNLVGDGAGAAAARRGRLPSGCSGQVSDRARGAPPRPRRARRLELRHRAAPPVLLRSRMPARDPGAWHRPALQRGRAEGDGRPGSPAPAGGAWGQLRGRSAVLAARSLPGPGEWPGGIAPPGSRRVKLTAGEVPLAGSFSVGLFPNRACKFPRTLLSSDHFGYGLVARPAWMSSWQRRQVIRVFRRRMAIKCMHSGLSRRPGLTTSPTLPTLYASRPAASSQISPRPPRSRQVNSLGRVVAMTGRWWVRTAVRARRSGIPPKRVTSGFLPLSRLMTTCRHLRGPAGVSTVALYLRAIALTVERCLPASVLSSEVSMTQCRRPRRNTSWASR